MVLVLGIVKTSLEKLGIGIGVKKWYCSCLVCSKNKKNTIKPENSSHMTRYETIEETQTQ